MRRSPPYRWLLVVVAAAVMGAAGTYQFVWSSLSGAVGAQIPGPVSETALGTVFTLFIVAQTLVQFPAGGIRDRYGPTRLLIVSGVLMFAGYATTAVATTMTAVSVGYLFGGLGAGVAYTVAVNTPVKWFHERRGLATGLVTMAYGGTSVVAIPLVRGSVDAAFTRTLLVLAAAVGLVGLVAAVVVRDPGEEVDDSPVPSDVGDEAEETEDAPTPSRENGGVDAVGWRTAARTWQFWVLYAVMVAINGVGLMLVGQSVGFATGLGFSADVATTVASAIALADGAGILVVSGLSDRFGGERTVGVSLLLCGGALGGAVLAGSAGLSTAFVVLVAATAFFRSPVFSIFPTLVASYYGAARSSENYAVIYTAKIPGGVFGGTVAGALVAAVGWATSFALGAALLVLAGLAALSLRPVDAAGRTEGASGSSE